MAQGFIATAEILRYTDSGVISPMEGTEIVRSYVDTIAFSVDPGTPVSSIYETVTAKLFFFNGRHDQLLSLKIMPDERQSSAA